LGEVFYKFEAELRRKWRYEAELRNESRSSSKLLAPKLLLGSILFYKSSAFTTKIPKNPVLNLTVNMPEKNSIKQKLRKQCIRITGRIKKARTRCIRAFENAI